MLQWTLATISCAIIRMIMMIYYDGIKGLVPLLQLLFLSTPVYTRTVLEAGTSKGEGPNEAQHEWTDKAVSRVKCQSI